MYTGTQLCVAGSVWVQVSLLDPVPSYKLLELDPNLIRSTGYKFFLIFEDCRFGLEAKFTNMAYQSTPALLSISISKDIPVHVLLKFNFKCFQLSSVKQNCLSSYHCFIIFYSGSGSVIFLLHFDSTVSGFASLGSSVVCIVGHNGS